MDVTVVALATGAVALVGLLVGLVGVRRRRGGHARRQPRVDALPSTVPVRFTTHARERMAQRGVAQRAVEATARAPHRVVPDAGNGSVALERDVDGDVLKVWVVAPWPPADDAVVVKSTAWQRVAVGRIPRHAIGAVVGPRGATIQAVERSTGARVAIDRATGTVRASAADRRAAEDALRQVVALARRA